MTLFRYEIPLSITLISPFATRGLVGSRASLDLPLARNQDDQLVLPGTLITGVLRAALTRLGESAAGDVNLGGQTRRLSEDLDALFGHESRTDLRPAHEGWRVANEPIRAQLAIRDLVIDAASQAKTLKDRRDYPRIKLDEDLGSVKEGFLQLVEMPFALGEEVTFAGIVDLKVGLVAPHRAVVLLKKALALVPALGAIKSAGFGRVAGCDLKIASPIRAAATSNAWPAAKPLLVTYTIDRPFLVGGRMASANLFKGSDIIPGVAIKGTLAAALSAVKTMSPAMTALVANLTIGHAFPQPAAGGKPWRPVPLSLAIAYQERRQILYDRLTNDSEISPRVNGRALMLAYRPDIKNEDPIKNALDLNPHSPGYDVRTRTKIDPIKGNAAFEDDAGQLFSYAAVIPKGFVWIGRIVLPENADPALVDEFVAFLGTGVVGLGKTGALMRATISNPNPLPQAASPEPKPPYALTLATPAALNDLDTLRQGRSLFDDYAAYWRGLGYRLERLFATQELIGGHLALRYPPKANRCEPYLLTEPGSVFRVAPENGARPLEALLTFGLPPNSWIEKPTWEHTPFLPTNGYGELRLNVVDHDGLAAGKDITPKEKQAA